MVGRPMVHAGEVVSPGNQGPPNGRRVKKACRKCPKCQHDVCVLKSEQAKVDKKCFDIDQEVVCIPRITFPWQKCPQTCAKTRIVNRLKVKKHQCCECQYTWELQENNCSSGCDSGQLTLPNSDLSQPSLSQPIDSNQPEFEPRVLYDPQGSDVPEPPATNRINN
ncbi:MAG: hypothetical protein AAGA30_06825 [Planctomycetota bacterium]